MEKYIASCVVQLKNRKGKPFQARLRYPDASKKKGWSEISRMVPEEIKSKREAGKWAEKWRAEMNAVADNMPSMEANKTSMLQRLDAPKRTDKVFASIPFDLSPFFIG